jgi:uncharacterized alpha-E superfamily protein
MISRVADHCFWFGRYLERAENTARVLPSTRHLAADGDLGPRECWLPIVTVAGEREAYEARFPADTAHDGDQVESYMTWDEQNASSVICSLRAVRENARSIREVLSLDVWQTLNELYLWMIGTDARIAWESDREAFYRRVRDGVLATLGMVRNTMAHDLPLEFIWLGVVLERASQTARILDVHWHATHNRHDAADTALWLTLLRTCSGVEGFMRRFQGRVTGQAVARFMMFERRFPRTIRFCVHEGCERFDRIRPPNEPDLPGGNAHLRLRMLDAWLDENADRDDAALTPARIHETLTRCVDEIDAICNEVSRELLGYDRG